VGTVITMTKISRTLKLCLGITSIVLLIVFTQIILSQIGGVESHAGAQNPPAKPSRYATEYNWSMSPGGDLGQPGDKLVNLPSCPPGVTGKEPEYWVLSAGQELQNRPRSRVELVREMAVPEACGSPPQMRTPRDMQSPARQVDCRRR
jgi:hypothetical protein